MELQILKEKFLTELIKWCTDSHTCRNNGFRIIIEGTEDGCDFWSTGYVHHGEDDNGNMQIWEVGIGELCVQFPDFYAMVHQRFYSDIEKFCTE